MKQACSWISQREVQGQDVSLMMCNSLKISRETCINLLGHYSHKKGSTFGIMQNVKDKYLHIQRSDCRPVALYITTDV